MILFRSDINTKFADMSTNDALSDNELIQLLKEDDNTAFTEIYNRYGNSLAGFAGSLLYNLDDAHDILHDIFVKLWEDRHSLEISGNLKSYLFTSTRYRIIDKIRRKVTRQDYVSKVRGIKLPQSFGADHILEAKELHTAVEKALQDLPPRIKEIYQLSREQYKTTSEIAQMLNISEQTVKNQLTSALKHLRQSLSYLSITAFIFLWL